MRCSTTVRPTLSSLALPGSGEGKIDNQHGQVISQTQAGTCPMSATTEQLPHPKLADALASCLRRERRPHTAADIFAMLLTSRPSAIRPATITETRGSTTFSGNGQDRVNSDNPTSNRHGHLDRAGHAHRVTSDAGLNDRFALPASIPPMNGSIKRQVLAISARYLLPATDIWIRALRIECTWLNYVLGHGVIRGTSTGPIFDNLLVSDPASDPFHSDGPASQNVEWS